MAMADVNDEEEIHQADPPLEGFFIKKANRIPPPPSIDPTKETEGNDIDETVQRVMNVFSHMKLTVRQGLEALDKTHDEILDLRI